MKKCLYSLFAFFLVILTSTNYATIAYAGDIPEGGEGCAVGIVVGGNYDGNCQPGLRCVVSGDEGQVSTCVRPPAELNCRCGAEGNAANGFNGIICDGRTEPAFCPSDQACFAAAGREYDITSGGTLTNPFGNATVKGVRCEAPTNSVACTCTPDGQISCIQNGETQVRPCIDDQAKCVPDPGGQMQYNPALIGDPAPFFGNRTQFNARDVKCQKPQAVCTCASSGISGSGKNGLHCEVTKSDGTKEVADTFCSDSGIACTSAPGETVTRAFLKDDILPGTDLIGVVCDRLRTDQNKVYPTTPPPPPPPCNVALTPEGCASFSTAIGLLGTKPEEFIASLFAFLLSISGGIAILLIMRSGYQMMTSQGEPQKLNNARDHLIAAIVGLIFLIFSFVILQIIGFDILRIPGFSGAGAGTGPGGNGVAGAPCDMSGNAQCSNGLTCVSAGIGNGRSGTCQ